MSAEHSRALLLAHGVSGQEQGTLLGHLNSARVMVSVDGQRADVVATAERLLTTLRRLPIGLGLRPGNLNEADVARMLRAVSAIDPVRGLALAEGPADLHIHVGPDAPAEAQISAMPERHGGHVAGPELVIGETLPASGLGVMSTAALASAEAFKTLVRARPERAVVHERLAWCPVTLSADPAATPLLPGNIKVHLAIVGLGAIGTAIASILGELPLTGTAMLIDPERFAPENLGTYSLGTAEDARRATPKVDLAAAALPRFTCLRESVAVAELVARIDAGQAPWPALVLAGTDSAEARRETQLLWPRRLIDGATGDTTCGLHDVRDDGKTACLQCLFAPDTSGPSSTVRLAQETGLPLELLRDGARLLSAEDLQAALPERREELSAQIGKPVCGLTEAVGLTTLAADDFRPSVSFVSQQAACLVVGRLVGELLGIGVGGSFIQYDALIGPHARLQEDRCPSPECFCQARRDIVSVVREARSKNILR